MTDIKKKREGEEKAIDVDKVRQRPPGVINQQRRLSDTRYKLINNYGTWVGANDTPVQTSTRQNAAHTIREVTRKRDTARDLTALFIWATITSLFGPRTNPETLTSSRRVTLAYLNQNIELNLPPTSAACWRHAKLIFSSIVVGESGRDGNKRQSYAFVYGGESSPRDFFPFRLIGT